MISFQLPLSGSLIVDNGVSVIVGWNVFQLPLSGSQLAHHDARDCLEELLPFNSLSRDHFAISVKED